MSSKLENCVPSGNGCGACVSSHEKIVRKGGIRWTIKDGIVYDAPALLEDVARMVAEAKAAVDGVVTSSDAH